MNIVVKTTPSPTLIRMSPGISAQYEPPGLIARPRASAPSAPVVSAVTRVGRSPRAVTTRPANVEPATTTAVGSRKAIPVSSAL
jgi:hypothetical protein